MKNNKSKTLTALIACVSVIFLSGCSETVDSSTISSPPSDTVASSDSSASLSSETDTSSDSSVSPSSETEISTEVSSSPEHEHSLTHTEEKAATCEESGNIEYWHCETCFKYFSDSEGLIEISYTDTVINATGHDWDTVNIEWEWAKDHSFAVATFTCKNDSSHSKDVNASVTSTTDSATCLEDGLVTYTAKAILDGITYTDTKTVTLNAGGHDWDDDLVCQTCGYEGGLSFTLNADNKSYSISGIGNYAENFADENENVVIEIPETFKGLPVTSIADNAFNNCDNVIEVIIPDNVTSVGSSAFKNCTSLAAVSFGENIASIGENAFEYCSSLSEISIPGSVSSIGTNAFGECTSLQTARMTEGAVSVGDSAFMNCSLLTSIFVPESITSIGDNAFSGCLSLLNIYWGGSSYLLDYSFPYGTVYCYCAEEPDTEGEFWHYDESGKPSVWSTMHTHDWDVENIVWEWADDLSSATATIACNLNSSHQKVIDAAVTVDNDSPCDIESYALYTASVDFENETYTDQIRKYVRASQHDIGSDHICSKCGYREGLEFDLNEDEESYTVSGIGDYGTYFGDENGKYELVIPETYDGWPVTEIGGEDKFWDNTSITSVTIGKNITTITSNSFNGCTSLTDVYIPDSVTTINNSAFSGCSSLKEITIPDSVTSLGDYVFNGCSKLEKAVLGSGVTSVGDNLFFQCSSLAEVEMPENIVSIGNQSFYQCTSLTSVIIPDKVSEIATFAFCSCSSLKEIVIPDSVKTLGYYAFSGCSNLESVRIGKGITSLDSAVFASCTSLTSVVIPDSVTSIYYNSFVYSTSLSYIFWEGSSYNVDYTFEYGTMYFYSEEEPDTEGNFWHYDASGNPTVWEINS